MITPQELVNKIEEARKVDLNLALMVDDVRASSSGCIYKFDGFMVCEVIIHDNCLDDYVDGVLADCFYNADDLVAALVKAVKS
jgi:hypothetical protein